MNIKLAKNYTIFFTGTGISAVAGFVGSVLYNRQFPPEVYGLYTVASTSYLVLYAFLCGWLASSFFRYYLEFKSNEKETDLFNTIFTVLAGINIGMLLVLLVFYKLVMNNDTGFMIMLFAFNILPRCLVDLFVSKYKLDNTMKGYFIVTSCNSVGTLVVSVLMIFAADMGIVSLVAAPIVVNAAILLVIALKERSFFRFRFDRVILKDFWTYGSPLIITGLINIALALSDRYLIKLFYTDREVGIYGYTYDFTDRTLRIFVNVFILTIQTYLMQVWHENKDNYNRAVKVYTRYYYIAFIPLVFIMDLVMDFMFQYVFDQKYLEGRAITLAVLISIFFDGLLSLANRGFVVNKETHPLRNASLAAIIFNIGLNLLLMGVFHFSYVTAAYTTLAAYAVYIIMVYILSIKKINWKWEFYDKVLLTSLPYWTACYILLRFVPWQTARLGILLPAFAGYYLVLPKDIRLMISNYCKLLLKKLTSR